MVRLLGDQQSLLHALFSRTPLYSDKNFEMSKQSWSISEGSTLKCCFIAVKMHGCLMISALNSGLSGPGPGKLCCVLGQDTLLSRCLSPPRCMNGYWRNAGGNPAMD